MNRKLRSRFTTHLLRIGAYVGAVFWLAFVYGGWELISTPETGRHSHLAGWTILLAAMAVMIATMDRWVKYFRVILAGGVLGGLMATGEAHLLNGSPFPRSIAAGMTALLIACSLISQTLAKRPLHMSDRVALIGFLGAFLGGMVEGTPTSALISVGVGFCCLLAAWLYNRFSSIPSTRGQASHS
jgi:hypothetical protein